MLPEIPQASFAKKLYSTYLSYLTGGENEISVADELWTPEAALQSF